MSLSTLGVRVSVPAEAARRVLAEPLAGLLIVLAALVVCVLLLAGCGGSSTPTPTHVAAQFVDGLDHGDYRQSCSVYAAGRKDPTGCVGYMSFLTTMGGQFKWYVVPHSAVVTGDTATVKIAIPGGKLTAHLSKVDGRWLIETIRAS